MDGFESQKGTPIPVELLDKYLTGSCTPEEGEQMRAWLDASSENAEFLGAFGGAGLSQRQYNPNSALEKFWEKNGSAVPITGRAMQGKALPVSLRSWVGYGASAMFLLALALWPWLQRATTNTPTYKTYITMPGQRARLQLPDGSVALLAPDSKMQYGDNRTIELEGQALFTVVQAAGNPFIVKMRGAETKVLGTSFTARRYASDPIARIIVAEGKVAVSNGISGRVSVLTTGDQADVKDNGTISSRRISDVAAALAWTQGRLEFTRTPLLSVIADAERMYNVKIKLSPETLANQLVTGVVDQSSPADAVHLLAAILGVNVERNGNTFTLMEK